MTPFLTPVFVPPVLVTAPLAEIVQYRVCRKSHDLIISNSCSPFVCSDTTINSRYIIDMLLAKMDSNYDDLYNI